MDIKTIDWKNGSIKIIDQTKLPSKLEYVYIKDLKGLWYAIKNMKVRGAPALGVAAAFGVYLGIKDSKAKDYGGLLKAMDKTIMRIGSARPTARNLFWGLERMAQTAIKNKNRPAVFIKSAILSEARKILKEEAETCRKIGLHGQRLLKKGDSVLTICNAGILATVDYGTALGVIYCAKEKGKNIKVFACETRPLLQGARLTSWELKKKGIDVTLICDNMAAALMKSGKIDKVIAGADRIAANGDAANKIGTYSLAVLSRYHGIPFYVAAPFSTFDTDIKTGKDIPIEQRKKEEVTSLFFKENIAPKGIKVFNPAFDVTPHELISAIITEKGIIRQPLGKNIKKIC
jgi:methylthioribose-1-phosphate isomerase